MGIYTTFETLYSILVSSSNIVAAVVLEPIGMSMVVIISDASEVDGIGGGYVVVALSPQEN